MKKIVTFVLLLSLAVALTLTALSVSQTANAEEIAPTTHFIETEEDFLNFHKKLILGECSNDTYVLSTDIYLDRLYAKGKKLGTPTSYAEPDETTRNLLGFNATFDGRGHAIVGLKEPFAYVIGQNGVIKNLQLIDVSGVNCALAIWNGGRVERVEVTGKTNYSAISYYNYGEIVRSLAVVEGAQMSSTVFAKTGTGTLAENMGYAGDGANTYFAGDGAYFDLDGKSNSYAELNYNLLTSKQKDLTCSLNLYNSPFIGVEDDLDLTEYLDENGSNVFFNAEKLEYTTLIESRTYSSPELTPSASTPSGEGTKENPYLIGSAGELIWLSDMSAGEYAMLTNNITLDNYDFNAYGYVVEELAGYFDGNGYSVTLGAVKDAYGKQIPLFDVIKGEGVITEKPTVKNLNVVGSFAGSLINNAVILDVTAQNSDVFAGVVDNSIIFGAKASGNEFVGSLASNSTIAYAIFKGEKFASNTQTTAQIVDCYYDATNSTDLGASLINLTSCVENSVLYAPGVYSIVDKSSATELNNITSWEFGQDGYGWVYVKGEVEDIPTLINAEDRAEYKEIITIENKNGQEKYGKINGFMRYELRTLPVGTDTTLYSPFDDGSNANLFVGANGAIYELLGGVSGGNTISNVNDIITSGLSLATKSYLDTKTLNWEVKAIGEDDYAPFTDSNFDPIAHPSSVFHLKFNDSVAYLEAYLTIKDSKVALEYAYVNKGVTLNDFVRNLDLINYYNGRLADAGLDYDDITIKLLGKDGSEITLTDGFIPVSSDYFDGASYTLNITTPSTQNYASSTQTHTISLLEGEMDYSDFDISSKIGGENEENAVIFDENGITPAPNNFSLLGYDFATLTLQEIVSRIDHEGYLIVGLDGIKDAGEYTLKLSVTQEYFVNKEIEVKFYVSPKEIEVYAKYDGLEEITIEYYDTLDASKVSYHLSDGSEITTLVGARYTTDYAVGNNITTGGNYYSLSFLAPLNEYDNPNYIVSESAKVVKIFVEPKSVYLDSDGFVGNTLTFDGKAHAIIVDESKIIKGDAPIFEYKLEYAFDGENKEEPFYFTNAGAYDISVTLTSLNANYLPTATTYTATLTITNKAVEISVDDVYVNYGETPEYSATITAKDGVEIVGGYDLYLIKGIDYTLTSTYQAGVTKAGATLPITISLSGVDQGGYTKISNFDVYVIKEEGALTIGKKTYAFDMVDAYEYTGKGVKLDFQGEEITFADGYPKYKYQTGGVAYDFNGTPSEACNSTFIYIACLKVDESDEYYGTMGVIEKTFTIYKKTIPVSGLYVFDGDVKTALGDNMSRVYDGENVTIDVDRTEFAGGGDVTFYFRYRTFSSDEYVESSSPIILKDATRIRDISLTIDGGANYEVWTSDVNVTSFEIAPKPIKLQNLAPLTYKGYAYTIDVLTARVNALGYEVGYAPIGEDVVTYSVSVLGGAVEIALPGTYTLIISSLKPNYTLGEDFRLGQTINTSKASIDLSGIDFGRFEYGALNASEAYVEREIEFKLDNEEVLTQTIKFFIDYNKANQFSSLAPGSYNVTRAESKSAIINGEETDLIAFEVVNGAGKIKVDPVEIAFDYLNMLEVGVGIKPSYVYGDDALKSLPTSVVRSMTWAVSTGTAFYTEIPKITISASATPKHAGEYAFTAKANYQTQNDAGDMVDCFKLREDLTTYKVVVEKRQVRYEVTPVQIYVGDSMPIFEVRFPISSSAPIIGDTLGYEFVVDGFDNTTEGEYAVTVKAKLNEGGNYYEDYELVKIDESLKELKVVYREFDISLSATGRDEVYSAEEILPVVVGLPDGATVTYSERPFNAGNYTVTVTVSKLGYKDKEFTCVVNIQKATPTIVFNSLRNIPYDVRYTLSGSDVDGYAHLNGLKVDGVFHFNKTNGLNDAETLRYGEYTYSVGFTPVSSNFNVIDSLDYVMKTHIPQGAYTLKAMGENLLPTLTNTDDITLTLTTDESLAGALHLLVGGSNTYYSDTPNSYVFTESEEDVLIDVMISNVSVYSITVDVVINRPVIDEPITPDVPITPDTPDDNESGSGSNGGGVQGGANGGEGEVTTPDKDESIKDENSNLGLIIGLSAGGGVLLIVAVVVVIIAVKKRK